LHANARPFLYEEQAFHFGLDVKQHGHQEPQRHKKTALGANPGGFFVGPKRLYALTAGAALRCVNFSLIRADLPLRSRK
jgi:hypothetical protein